MGVWQKTLFYLGLVDEDAGQYEGPYSDPEPEGVAAGTRSPSYGVPGRGPGAAASPQARRRQATRPPGYDDAVSPSLTTGERMAANRRQTQPVMPQQTGVQGRRVEPPMAARRRPAVDRALSEAGVVVTSGDRPLVRTVSDADLESEVIVARSYSDAQILADHIRANIPVVLDLRKVEPAMVRRLVDFASGLTYALGGSMRKIAQGVVLVNPANVNISRDEKRRLKDLGYYQAPEEH